ncbi:MAG: ABC transporter substrate-binding protein [Candidatus Sericytochromatia bacterium]|nr:ABC transporter substrate-binding protein [Candidatus Tanganyikabacteria bacterium]
MQPQLRKLAILSLLLTIPGLGCEPSRDKAGRTGGVATGSNLVEVVPPKVEEPSKEAVDAGIGRSGGTLTTAMISDPKTFNYYLSQETSSSTPLLFVFEGMAEVNAVTGKVQPALAEKWDVSGDQTTYTFTLRQGLKWSDGQPLTADDVDFTFNQIILNPDVHSDWRDILLIDGQPPTVKKLDDLRVQVTTPKPFAPFLRSFGVAPIMPRHALVESISGKDPRSGKPLFNQTWTVGTDVSKIPGNGPFVFSEFRPGERIVYKKNPFYWRVDTQGNRLPYLDRMVLMIVKDQNQGVLKFQSEETDILFADAPLRGQDFAALKPREQAGNFTIYKAGPDFGTLFLMFNQTTDVSPDGKPYVEPRRLKWFRDREFRRGIAHAIDKDSIIKNVYQGIAIPQIAAESQTSPFYNDKVPTYDYNLAKAQEILAAAGYKKTGDVLRDKAGNPVSFTLYTNSENNERKAIAQLIKTDLKKLGIDVKFQAIQFNVLVQKTSTSLDWEAVLMGLTGNLEPAMGKAVWWSEGRMHMFNQKLPASKKWTAQPWEKDIDKLFDEANTTLDDPKRKELYDRYQVVAAEQLPYIYIVNRIQLYPVRNVFRNLHVTPIGGPVWNIWLLARSDLK